MILKGITCNVAFWRKVCHASPTRHRTNQYYWHPVRVNPGSSEASRISLPTPARDRRARSSTRRQLLETEPGSERVDPWLNVAHLRSSDFIWLDIVPHLPEYENRTRLCANLGSRSRRNGKSLDSYWPEQNVVNASNCPLAVWMSCSKGFRHYSSDHRCYKLLLEPYPLQTHFPSRADLPGRSALSRFARAQPSSQ
jgi:hypothetical protein